MLIVDAISKTYGTHQAVAEISFQANPGTVTGVVGPNGAGKSTVLKMIAGLVHPDSGQITLNGEKFSQAQAPGQTLGIFLSAEWLPPKSTPQTVLNYAGRVHQLPPERVDSVLAEVGLSHVATQRIGSFSLGMRQRLGIAVATISQPDVFILDEPINGLDPDGIQWIRRYLQDQARQGRAVLLSSHHMAELGLVAEYIVMIGDGVVLRSGKISEFWRSKPANTPT